MRACAVSFWRSFVFILFSGQKLRPQLVELPLQLAERGFLSPTTEERNFSAILKKVERQQEQRRYGRQQHDPGKGKQKPFGELPPSRVAGMNGPEHYGHPYRERKGPGANYNSAHGLFLGARVREFVIQ